MTEPKICNICGSVKVFREAGIGRNGNAFDAFWSCPQWKNADHAKAKAEKAVFKPIPDAFKSPTVNENTSDGNILVMESLNEVIRLLNDISNFLGVQNKKADFLGVQKKAEASILPKDDISIKDIPF